MKKQNPYKNKDLRKFIESIPKEEIEKQNRLQIGNTEKVYKEFITALDRNKCFLCGLNMDKFVENEPCFHWFTYPPGIKKKFFRDYFKNPISYFRLECYLRWLANTESPIRNINDLKDETSTNSYLETTIKYKNIEWAFSVGFTDKEGHDNSQFGDDPHYHIQMKVDDRIFIKFKDFHIKFSDDDLFYMELMRQAGDKIVTTRSHGHGIGMIGNQDDLKFIDEHMTLTENEENGTFSRQTSIEAPEGQTIPGELIYEAIMESKITKKPVGYILRNKLKDAKIITVISPGQGVPQMSRRSRKKVRKD
jgi:hypothetical protein